MGGQQLTYLFPILLIAIFYFLLIRPQKKREKQVKEMRENVKVGNKVITIGGVHGKVAKIKDDVLTLEVGPDKIKMPFTRWAISSVDDGNKQPVKEAKSKKKEKKEAPVTEAPEVKEVAEKPEVTSEAVQEKEKNE